MKHYSSCMSFRNFPLLEQSPLIGEIGRRPPDSAPSPQAGPLYLLLFRSLVHSAVIVAVPGAAAATGGRAKSVKTSLTME